MGLFSKQQQQQQQQSGAPTDKLAESTVNPDLPIAAVVVQDEKDNIPQTAKQHGVRSGVFISTRRPVHLTCPHCSTSNVKTRTRTAPSFVTWVAAGVTLIVLWPLCWLPLVLDNCKDTQHFCPNCNKEVGKVQAFSDCCVSHRG